MCVWLLRQNYFLYSVDKLIILEFRLIFPSLIYLFCFCFIFFTQTPVTHIYRYEKLWVIQVLLFLRERLYSFSQIYLLISFIKIVYFSFSSYLIQLRLSYSNLQNTSNSWLLTTNIILHCYKQQCIFYHAKINVILFPVSMQNFPSRVANNIQT